MYSPASTSSGKKLVRPSDSPLSETFAPEGVLETARYPTNAFFTESKNSTMLGETFSLANVYWCRWFCLGPPDSPSRGVSASDRPDSVDALSSRRLPVYNPHTSSPLRAEPRGWRGRVPPSDESVSA